MAKVFISYKAGYSDCFYQDLEETLLSEGNEVFIINWQNRTHSEYHELCRKLKSFAPSVVFDFNNSCPNMITRSIECPICVFEGDMPYLESYLGNNNYDNLKRDNVYYIALDSGSKKVLDRYLGWQFPEKRFFFLPMATGFYRKKLDFQRNIFFCGANWYAEKPYLPNLTKFNKNIFDLYQVYQYRDQWIDLIKNNPDFGVLLNCIFCTFSGQKRLKYLAQLSDLGLEIYGRDWSSVGWEYDMSLAQLCKDKVITDSSIIDYYNSSKISVNFSSPQCVNSFSFRVIDIMATNSCVLTEDKKDWHIIFDQYISKEVQDAILYKDCYDMRYKAIRLLKDEALRQRCVKECNRAVEQNGRWVHRLGSLEKLLGIKFIKVGPKCVAKGEYFYTEKLSKEHKIDKSERIKNILNGLGLIIIHLPLIEYLIPNRLKNKLINSIIKHCPFDQMRALKNIKDIENAIRKITKKS